MTKKLNNNHYAGHYVIKKRKVGETPEQAVTVADFENLITTAGITQDNSGGVWRTTYCLFGTGTTAPAASDTDLEQPLGSVATTGAQYMGWDTAVVPVQTTVLPYEYKIKAIANFTPGIVSGNLTEIGLFQPDGLGGYLLFSRALIKDSNGNPTTLTVLPDEYLDVYYYLRTFYNPITAPFSVSINGVVKTGNYYYRLGDPATYGGDISRLFQAPGPISFYTGNLNIADPLSSVYNGDLIGVSTLPYGTSSYTPGTKYVDVTYSFIPGHGAWDFDVIALGNSNPLHIFKFDQTVSKSAAESLDITFRYSWDKA